VTDVGLVVRYRKAVSYGMHALMAALETAGADCTVTLGGTAQECAGLITASRSDVVLVLWSFYSPDAEAMAADLAELGARIHAHTFMPLPGTPWRDASPAFIPLETMRDLDRLALQGASYGHWRKQAEHAARLAETARAYPRRTRRRRTEG
jgi:hypothetical protein